MRKSLRTGLLILTLVISISAPSARADDEVLIKYFDLTEGRILFTYSVADEKPRLFVLDFATLVAAAIPTAGGSVSSGRFAPDGKRIAYVSDKSGANQIYIADADGSGATAIGGGETPDWSPDGKKLTFVSNRSGHSVDVYTMNTDGSGIEPLTKSTRQYASPRWSPSNEEVMFVTNEYWPGTDLLSYNFRAKKISIITTGYVSSSRPAWDRKGERYAYVFGPAEDPDIWLSKRDGGKPTAVIARPGKDLDPEWVDDKRMLFLGETSPGLGHFEVFIVDVTTQEAFQITECPGTIRDLSWTPKSPVHLKPKATPHPDLGEGPPIAIPPEIKTTPTPSNEP